MLVITPVRQWFATRQQFRETANALGDLDVLEAPEPAYPELNDLRQRASTVLQRQTEYQLSRYLLGEAERLGITFDPRFHCVVGADPAQEFENELYVEMSEAIIRKLKRRGE